MSTWSDVEDKVSRLMGAVPALTKGVGAAADLVSARREWRALQMSQKGSGLARLMGGLKNLDANADALATRLEAAMGSLDGEMATTTQIVGNLETSVNDLRAVNALYSNGGPPLPTSSGSGSSSAS